MDRSNDSQVHWSITGTDFLQLDRADAPAGGLADWLAQHLRAAIADGRLPVGSRLPATRVLAERAARVPRRGHRGLPAADRGRPAGRARPGRDAGGRRPRRAPARAGIPARPSATSPARPSAARPPSPPPPTRPPAATRPAAPPPDLFPALPGTEVFEALRAVPSRIDLSPGVPDLAAFPRAAWLRAERTVLDDLSPSSFGYGEPRGAPAFRVAVANWLARNRGIRVSPDEVIVVAGVAQALALLALTLRAAGLPAVAVEDPGSLGARQQLRSWGLDTPPVPVDAHGLRVAELRASRRARPSCSPRPTSSRPAWCSAVPGGASCGSGPATAA